MSDHKMYDILKNFNSTTIKENPTSSKEIETLVEDTNNENTLVDSLNEKYKKFIAEADAPRGFSSTARSKEVTDDPKVNKLLTKARIDRPQAKSDMEAILYQVAKQDDAIDQARDQVSALKAANDEQEQRLNALDAKVPPSPSTIQPTVAPTAPTPVAVPKPTVATTRLPTPITQRLPGQIPTEVPTPAPAQTQAQPKQKRVISKKTTDEIPTDFPSADGKVADFGKFKAKKEKELLDLDQLQTLGTGTFGPKENKSMKDMLKESIQILNEYKEGDPTLGIYNYNDMLTKFKTGVQKVQLHFGPGKDLTLYDYQVYGLLAYLTSEKNPERQVAGIESIMSSYDSVVNTLMLPKVKQYIALFPEFEKKSPIYKQRSRDIEKNKFQLEPTTAKDPGEMPPSQTHPYQQSDSQLEENLGTDVMSNNIYNILDKLHSLEPKEIIQSAEEKKSPVYENVEARGNILEAVKQLEEKYMGFKKTVAAVKKGGSAEDPEAVAAAIGRKKYGKAKFQKAAAAGKKLGEASKPDFLDLDKDGDTEEPMKAAAKDAKEHEPAKVDKSAVEKRKRLQALKDKQEDERAEKGDYDSKSSTRVIKGRAYGGAAQKDDEEKDLDESGLQAYLGKKKYGKEGMKALQKAGREGASKEKMALIRAKHDKMDEVAPPGAKAERMVKHIKKGYAKDGKLTPKEKGIAYATAWKAHNKGQVEEGTEFGDTIKNSEAKMTKVKMTEGKEAIRNHPIYTNEEAWNHYKQELDEQEAMETSMTEAPVVDVQEELNEIARLAGLAPKMEAKCSSCGCADCKCNESMGCSREELEEAMSRKNYREMADKIRNMTNREDAKNVCRTFAEMAKADNPRFKEEMFYAACGIDIAECGMTPATVLVGEEETMDEGNEFTKARLDAIAAGNDTFTVGGKTYNVSGDTSQEKTQVEESTETVTEDININVSANGEEDVVNLIRKLSGMPVVAIQAQPVAEEYCDACDSTECHCEAIEEERDIEHTNTPREVTAPVSASIPSGDGDDRAKQQYSKEYMGDNHMAVKEEALWKAYESLISDIKS